MKVAEQEKAITLRKRGYSLSEIHRELGVAKSSVSLWVRDVSLSPSVKSKLLDKFTSGQLKSQEVLREKHLNKLARIQSEVAKDFTDFDYSRVNKLVICSLLYWCEGNKGKSGGVSFTNSDPNLVKTFLTLLRQVFPLDERKFRVCMHLHPHHNEQKQKKFWANITNISPEQFNKSFLKQNSGKYKKEGYQGCIRVRYHDSELMYKLFMASALFMKKFS